MGRVMKTHLTYWPLVEINVDSWRHVYDICCRRCRVMSQRRHETAASRTRICVDSTWHSNVRLLRNCENCPWASHSTTLLMDRIKSQDASKPKRCPRLWVIRFKNNVRKRDEDWAISAMSMTHIIVSANLSQSAATRAERDCDIHRLSC